VPGVTLLAMARIRFLLATALLGLPLVAGSSPPAAAAATCSIQQVTVTTGGDSSGNFANFRPAISGDGRVIAFTSDRNQGEDNADANHEIVRWVRSSGSFRQITDTTGGTGFANSSASIDDDGNRIAFVTNRNLDGTNPQLNREVYVWTGGRITSLDPVTSFTTASSGGPSIDAAGNRIALVSDSIATGTNQDANDEIWVADLGNDTLTQMTQTTGTGNSSPELSATGKQVVFVSENEIAGTNGDHSLEVFRHDLVSNTTRAVTDALEPASSGGASISANGRRIAFPSNASFAGRNADGSEELHLAEVSAGTVTALTSTDPDTDVGGVAINDAGTRVAFESTSALRGPNTDEGYELYLRDFGPTGVRLTRVTDSPASSGEADVDRSGRRVVFTSRGDFTGQNADGNREIFLATCSLPPTPAICDGQLVTVDRNRNEAPTAAADVIRGRPGADVVSGKGGVDRFCGGGGPDTFNGGPGDDRAFGQAGNDRLRGDGGNDRLDGSTGADVLNGGGGVDTCRGGPQTDTSTACETRAGIP
jgi:Tol biopolymer transport system component